MNLTNEKTLIEVLKKHNLWANKRFGQNFLINQDVLSKIIIAGEIKKTDHVIEIGPGLGTLTLALAPLAKKVTTIEKDRTLIPILKENLRDYSNIEILQEDALKFTPPNTKYKVIANIPYNITSPLLNLFLKAKNRPELIVFLVQKEVAQKICEQKKQSVLSLQVQIFGEPKIIAKVKPESFYPSPKVDSAILKIETYKKPLVKNPEEVLVLAKKAFSQRRKKLSNSLDTEDPRFKDKRPEHLAIEEWEKLIE